MLRGDFNPPTCQRKAKRQEPVELPPGAAAITRLEAEGPRLGRPTADRIKGSRHQNMKELRPGSAGHSEIGILFAFDPRRRAILLTAGDKSGRWKRWYDLNIPIADDRFDEWLDNEEE